MNPFAIAIGAALVMALLKLFDIVECPPWLVVIFGVPALGLWGFLMVIGLRAVWLGMHEADTGRRYLFGVRK